MIMAQQMPKPDKRLEVYRDQMTRELVLPDGTRISDTELIRMTAEQAMRRLGEAFQKAGMTVQEAGEAMAMMAQASPSLDWSNRHLYSCCAPAPEATCHVFTEPTVFGKENAERIINTVERAEDPEPEPEGDPRFPGYNAFKKKLKQQQEEETDE